MRLVFAGTPEFATTALQAIHAAGFEVPLVLTQPDRPAGRGLKLQASPVKQWAVDHGLPVSQPRSLRLDGKFPQDAQEAREALQAARADAMVVAAYGLILPTWVLALPRHGCLNIHGSLLPRWRGAAPIHRAIEAGDTETGITIMQMDAGLDTGPMLLAEREPIHADDTTALLHDRLAALGGRLIVQALRRIDVSDHSVAGSDAGTASGLQPQPQPLEGVTYAHKIDKAEARIDWRSPAALIERRVRAFDPFPGASFESEGVSVKLWRASVVDAQGAPGTVLAAPPGRCIVACGEGALELLELQRPGGRRGPAAAFLQAHALAVGSVLA